MGIRFTLGSLKSAVILMAAQMVAVSAFAQSPDAGALQQQLERQLPSLAPLPDVGPKPTPAQPIKNPDEKKVFVKSFRLQGNTLFTDQQLLPLIQSWENRNLTFSEIQEVCNVISDFYRKKDYVARVTVPEQDATGGNILLNITEVKLGSVSIMRAPSDSKARFDIGIAQNFIDFYQKQNDFLRVDHLEHGIMNLNELPGVNFQGTLEPTDSENGVKFVGNLIDTPQVTGRAELSNYGSRSTGVAQALGVVNLNDPFGEGSLFSLSGIGSEGSFYGRMSASKPFGSSGFNMGLTASYFDYRNVGVFDTNGPRGNAATYSWNANYPILRGVQANMNLVTGVDNKNYLNLTTIPYAVISNYNIQNAYFGANGNFFGPLNALSYWSLVGTNGQLAINDLNQLSQDSSTAGTQGNFKKLNGAISRYQNLIGDQTVLLMSFSGQLANANLNSAEQFYLGGPNGVRAYPVAQGGGAQGYIATLEMQQRVSQIKSQLIAFVDMGRVQQYKTTWDGWQGLTGAANTYNLYGAGFGVRFADGNTQVNASLAWPIGNNPLLTNTGAQLNVDDRRLIPQGWIQGVYYF